MGKFIRIGIDLANSGLLACRKFSLAVACAHGEGRQMKVGKVQRPSGYRCPSCSRLLTAVNDNAKPMPGDIAICMYCGHVMTYGDDLCLRALTIEKMAAKAHDERILAIKRALSKIFPKSMGK
jgi:hypothetical protein